MQRCRIICPAWPARLRTEMADGVAARPLPLQRPGGTAARGPAPLPRHTLHPFPAHSTEYYSCVIIRTYRSTPLLPYLSWLSVPPLVPSPRRTRQLLAACGLRLAGFGPVAPLTAPVSRSLLCPSRLHPVPSASSRRPPIDPVPALLPAWHAMRHASAIGTLRRSTVSMARPA